MALDRQSIEKKDFPIGRRGYDPDAVNAHLRALADEVEELKRSSGRRSESLAAVASEQVRSLVEAAEATAADIQRRAEDEAREIRAEASSEAEATREHATAEARHYVGKVAGSTTGMLERIDAMENELAALIESLRSGCHRLNADVQLLEGDLASVKTAVVTRARFEPEPAGAAAATEAAAAPAPALEQAAPAVPTAEPFEASVGVVGAGAGEVLSDASAAPAPAGPANGAEDESARLIALNMVMNNTPREEIERYLAEHFRLSDRRGLLDEVYSSFQN
ncbi:MAG: DivIVA domain-containing protein [Solirubrobacterales bacterium]|nr:DivIVA domain-containing protein [Solirubrobacterales bacterium]